MKNTLKIFLFAAVLLIARAGYSGTSCTLTCPADIGVNNDPNQCGAVVLYSPPITSGTCGTVTCAAASGSFFPATFGSNSTTVICTSQFGPTCNFDVTVNDVQAPITTCPNDQTVVAPGSTNVAYSGETVFDACPGATVNCAPVSGSSFNQGTTEVTCTGSDLSGNNSSCDFDVNVNAQCGLTCPGDITVENDLNECGASVDFEAPITAGTCGTISLTNTSGSFFSVGSTEVTASDDGGSGAICSFVVNVDDTQAPEIDCPGNIEAAVSESTVEDFTVTASDNCPGVIDDCNPISGSVFPIGSTAVDCGAEDEAGNTAECDFSVILTQANPNVEIGGTGCAMHAGDASSGPEGMAVAGLIAALGFAALRRKAL